MGEGEREERGRKSRNAEQFCSGFDRALSWMSTIMLRLCEKSPFPRRQMLKLTWESSCLKLISVSGKKKKGIYMYILYIIWRKSEKIAKF